MLYVVRHGITDPFVLGRPLSKKGFSQVNASAEFLKNKNVNVDAIYYSNTTRTIETARIFSKILHCSRMLQDSRLGLGNIYYLNDFINEILNLTSDILIVSHQPVMMALIETLFKNQSLCLQELLFEEACIICVKLEDPIEILWEFSPKKNGLV